MPTKKKIKKSDDFIWPGELSGQIAKAIHLKYGTEVTRDMSAWLGVYAISLVNEKLRKIGAGIQLK